MSATLTAVLALASQSTSPKAAQDWTLWVGGDIMLNGVSPKVAPFANLKSQFRAGDVVIANLEVPLTSRNERTTRKTAAEVKARQQYILTASPAFAKQLGAVPFSAVSLANNHAMDAGVSGLKQMQMLLSQHKVVHFGAGENWEAASQVRFISTPTGTKIGLWGSLSFLNASALKKCWPASKSGAGINVYSPLWNDPARLERIVEKAKQQCDLLFAFPHWGIERQPLPNVHQVRFARQLIEAGFDGVFGSHPHVLQPGETYRGKPIVYSLGNLVGPGSGMTAVFKLRYNASRLKSVGVLALRYSGGKIAIAKVPLIAFTRQEVALAKRFLRPVAISPNILSLTCRSDQQICQMTGRDASVPQNF